MKAPLVSVCIPTYRYGRFIGKAIESVLAQEFKDFELIVVDDASPDDTRQVVESFTARDERVVFEINGSNRGMVPNWNYCLSIARGRYIKFMFGDDFFCSAKALGDMVSAMERDADLSLVFSARQFVDESGAEIKIANPFGLDMKRISGQSLITFCLARMNNPIGEPTTVMFRKAAGTRGFDPRYQQLVDLEMWLHLLKTGDALYLPSALSAFRIHGAQQTTVNVRYLQDDRLLLAQEYLNRNGFLQRYLEYCQYYYWWKLARGTEADRMQVMRRIRSRYSIWQFFLMLPLYKMFTPLYKLITPVMYRV